MPPGPRDAHFQNVNGPAFQPGNPNNGLFAPLRRMVNAMVNQLQGIFFPFSVSDEGPRTHRLCRTRGHLSVCLIGNPPMTYPTRDAQVNTRHLDTLSHPEKCMQFLRETGDETVEMTLPTAIELGTNGDFSLLWAEFLALYDIIPYVQPRCPGHIPGAPCFRPPGDPRPLHLMRTVRRGTYGGTIRETIACLAASGFLGAGHGVAVAQPVANPLAQLGGNLRVQTVVGKKRGMPVVALVVDEAAAGVAQQGPRPMKRYKNNNTAVPTSGGAHVMWK